MGNPIFIRQTKELQNCNCYQGQHPRVTGYGSFSVQWQGMYSKHYLPAQGRRRHLQPESARLATRTSNPGSATGTNSTPLRIVPVGAVKSVDGAESVRGILNAPLSVNFTTELAVRAPCPVVM